MCCEPAAVFCACCLCTSAYLLQLHRRTAQSSGRAPQAHHSPVCRQVAHLAGLALLPTLQDAAAGEAVSLAAGTYSHAFSSAVLALLPHAQQPGAPKDRAAATALAAAALAGPGLAELLLMAHHPASTAGVACKQKTWQQASRRLLGAADAALKATAADTLRVLFGPNGLGSACPGDVAAAQLALGSAMAVAPGACLEPLLVGLGKWLDRSEHDSLTDDDIAAYNTPEGMLASDVVPAGVYVPEVVTSKNVRRARGRMRSDSRAFAAADGDEDDDEPPLPPKHALPVRPSAAAAGRSAGRAGAGAAGKGPKDAAARQAELRVKKLQEEAEIRARVRGLKARLDTGLAALQASVEGNTSFAASHLRELGALSQPLLASPVSGEYVLVD
eukprot:GHRQ01025864.1.p1 GENE.GHRQ01025864.1~~GHRQ01025864.1.p1  ORF type:complete len:387 (+),score=135.80 GHRQ01025864.1:731-1891(+)